MGIAATGRAVELYGMDLLDFENGRIAGNCIYFDQLGFARQVGMLPPERSRRDRLLTASLQSDGSRPQASPSVALKLPASSIDGAVSRNLTRGR